MYALINDRPVPVEALRSVVFGPRGRLMITGATANSADRSEVEKALSPLHVKDVVTFNVVTSDWRSISGRARIMHVKLAGSK